MSSTKTTRNLRLLPAHVLERLGNLASDLLYPPTPSGQSGLLRISDTAERRAKRARRRAGDVFARIVQVMCEVLDFDSGALMIADHDEGRYSLSAFVDLPPDLLQILVNGEGLLGLEDKLSALEPVVIGVDGDAPGPARTALTLFGYRTMAFMPFLSEPRRFGALLLFHCGELWDGEEAEESLESALVLAQGQIQLTMDVLTLQLRELKRIQRMRAVRDGLKHLASSSHPDELLQSLCDQLRHVFGCTVTWMAMIGQDIDGSPLIQPVEVSGAPAVLLDSIKSWSDHPSCKFLDTVNPGEVRSAQTTAKKILRPEIYERALGDSAHPLNRIVDPDAMLATVAVPLAAGDETTGFLVLHRDRPFHLTEEDRNVLQIFSDQAVLAHKTSRLLHEAEERSERLKASEGVYKSFVRQLSDGIFRLDDGGNLVELSDCAAELFGVERKNAVGRPLVECFAASAHGPLGGAFASARGGESCELTLKVQRPDDRPMVAVVRIGPLMVGGEVMGLIGVARDDTSRTAMQSKLLVREKLASVGMLSGGVAHEINNPLAYVISNLSTLLEDREMAFGPEERREMLGECLDGAKRIQRIVVNLRQFSQQSGNEEREETPLAPLIESTAWLVYPEARYTGHIQLDLDPDLPAVHCNPGRIAQLLLQLLLNAIQALPPGEPDRRAIRVRARGIEGNSAVLIEIEDDGPGIPREVLPMIIEPFYTTRGADEASGLGLIISQEVVQRHGGSLHIRTEEGRGTTVSVTLPVSPAASRASGSTLTLQYGDEILSR